MYRHPSSPEDELSVRRLGLQRTEYDVQSKLSESGARRQHLFAQNAYDARAVEDGKLAARSKFEADRQNLVLRHTSPLKQNAFGSSGSTRSPSPDWLASASGVAAATHCRLASPAPTAAPGRLHAPSPASAYRSASPAGGRNYSAGSFASADEAAYQAARQRFESPTAARSNSSASVLAGRDVSAQLPEGRAGQRHMASLRVGASPAQGRTGSSSDVASGGGDSRARWAEPPFSTGPRYSSPRPTEAGRGRTMTSGSELGREPPVARADAPAASRAPSPLPMGRQPTLYSALPAGTFLSQPVEFKPRTLIGHFVQLKQTVPKFMEQASAPSTQVGVAQSEAAGSTVHGSSPMMQRSNQSASYAPAPIPPAPAQGDIAMRLLRSFNNHVAKGRDKNAVAPPPPPRRPEGFPRPGGEPQPLLSRRGRSPSSGAGRAFSSGSVLGGGSSSVAPEPQMPLSLSRRGRSPSPAAGRTFSSASVLTAACGERGHEPSPSARFASADFVATRSSRASSPAPQALANAQVTPQAQPVIPPPPPPRRALAPPVHEQDLLEGLTPRSIRGCSATPVRGSTNHSVMEEVMAPPTKPIVDVAVADYSDEVDPGSTVGFPGRTLPRRVRGRSTTPVRGSTSSVFLEQRSSEPPLLSPPPPPARRLGQQHPMSAQPVSPPTSAKGGALVVRVDSPGSPLSDADPQSPVLEAVHDLKDAIMKLEAARQADNKVLNDLKALCFDLETRDASKLSANGSPSKGSRSPSPPPRQTSPSRMPSESSSPEASQQSNRWVQETLLSHDGPRWVQKVSWVQAQESSPESQPQSPWSARHENAGHPAKASPPKAVASDSTLLRIQRQAEEIPAAKMEIITEAQRRHAAAIARVQVREERARAREEDARIEEKFASARREVKRELAAEGAVGDEQERFLFIEARTLAKVQAQERCAAQKAARQNERSAAEDEQTRLLAASESAARERVEKEVEKTVAIEMAKFREVENARTWDTAVTAEHFDEIQKESDETYVELTLEDMEMRRREDKERLKQKTAEIQEKETAAKGDVTMESMARRAAEEGRRNAQMEWSDYRRKVEEEAEGVRAAVRERARLEKDARTEVDRNRIEGELRVYLDAEKRNKESAENLALAFSAPSPPIKTSAFAAYAILVDQAPSGALASSEQSVAPEPQRAHTPTAGPHAEKEEASASVEFSASLAAAVAQRVEERRKQLELAKAEADAHAAAAELARLKAVAEEERLIREAEEDRVRSAAAAAKFEAEKAAAAAARAPAEQEAAEAARLEAEAVAVGAALRKAELDHDDAVALAFHRVSRFLSRSKGVVSNKKGEGAEMPGLQ